MSVLYLNKFVSPIFLGDTYIDKTGKIWYKTITFENGDTEYHYDKESNAEEGPEAA